MAEFPSCIICDKPFSLRGPTPSLLPCLHAVCETCVTSAADGVIPCSPCQKKVNLAETPLQKDVIREKETLHLTMKHNPEFVLCTHEEDGNQAMCWCKDCEEFLCEHCQMVHNSFKGTKRHMVYEIGKLEADAFHQEKHCTVAQNDIADTMDLACKKVTCTKCRKEDLDERKADLAKQKLTSLKEDVQCTIDKHRAYIATAEKRIQSSDEICRKFDDQINHSFNLLKTLLDQREKKLQIDLKHHKDKVEEERDMKKTSEACLQRCQVASDYITKTLQYSGKHEILCLKPQLESVSLDCISSAPSEDCHRSPLPVFNTEGLEMIKSTLARFGTVETENDGCTSTSKGRANGDNEEDPSTQESESTSIVGELEATVVYSRTQLHATTKEAERQSPQKISSSVLDTTVSQLIAERDDALQMFKEKLTCLLELYQQGFCPTSSILDKRYLLQRIQVSFDRSKVNVQKVTLTVDNELVNTIPSNPSPGANNFNNYWGTCSETPLVLDECPTYFEVNTITLLDKVLTGNKLILEVGLVHKEDRDKHFSLDMLPKACSLSVGHWSLRDSICTKVWKDRKLVHYLPGILENKVGSSSTVQIGVVSDSERGIVAFLDVGSMKTIAVLDNVDFSCNLWPMFAVYCHDFAFVSMTLVTGKEISMTDEKRALILKFISS